jgi:hypothetical protein
LIKKFRNKKQRKTSFNKKMFGQKIKNLAHSEDLKSAENYFLLYFQQL